MTDHAIEAPSGSFSDRLIDILNMGAINLAMGIGYRLGLFEALDGFDRPQTAETIAETAGLSARYTLEWLSIMATGGIVRLSQDADGVPLFDLPGAHADLLCRRAGNANLGVYTQEIPILTASAYHRICSAFTSGEGIPYRSYPDFHQFMGELADAKHRQVLIERFLPSVDKGRIVQRMQQGIRVCDLGCSEGVALLIMAQAYPKSTFVGMDISEQALAEAGAEAMRLGLGNVEFVRIDAAALAENDAYRASFDYVTAFDAIHDQSQPLAALKGVHHILKEGAAFSMVDIAAETDVAQNLAHPMAPFLYTVSLMHCLPVGLVDNGMGLGMMWGRQRALELLREAGFEEVSVVDIPDDAFNFHFFCRK
ncbi:class I SAM-dependent methyltransferase [Desulfatirhabdium butyrativorans]|uniref:class I SAM-dependent methyltransferase n=1 Tax=Desulfatirhabdium butyrativorans TaxID=340467 RepID=UPI0004287C43|nr:class I SAM-dependent methyltransferase [Desulfatirhabdium butyrativorans]